MNGLLAPARGSHSRAVSLPVFAQPDGNGNEQQGGSRGRGHQYQNSFSGGLGNGGFNSGYGLGIDGQGHGLNGWAEEEVAGN